MSYVNSLQALRRHLAQQPKDEKRERERVRWQIKAGGNFMLIRALPPRSAAENICAAIVKATE